VTEPLAEEARVHCPHCGAAVTIALDAGGGTLQEYIEDCQVCCRPWQVQVRFTARGEAVVDVSPA
jgi:transposase-like protein